MIRHESRAHTHWISYIPPNSVAREAIQLLAFIEEAGSGTPDQPTEKSWERKKEGVFAVTCWRWQRPVFVSIIFWQSIILLQSAQASVRRRKINYSVGLAAPLWRAYNNSMICDILLHIFRTTAG